MALVSREDLKFGRKGVIPDLYSAAIGKLFAIDKINALEERASHAPEGEEAACLLRQLGITVRVAEKDLANIPLEGPAIIVSNHPTGALEGIILIDMLSRLRPDVKFMGNFLLDKISFFKKYFIAVNPFDTSARGKNLSGMRRSLQHVKEGGLLVVFPAGEVATWQKGFRNPQDKPWGRSIVRFIRGAECPVVPMCIEARNSRRFHLAGKIHPMLRTAMLPHELVNKRGKTITVNVASPVTPKKTAHLTEVQYGGYLRANVEYLHTPEKRRKKIKCVPLKTKGEEIIAPVPTETLLKEMNDIAPRCLLFEQGVYKVFFAPPETIPNMLTEIGRMREVTFRQIGEGSMKQIDTDSYDTYYHQLFIWDTAAQALVGAYRMGMGAEIVPLYGLRGFYTDTLFRMDKDMLPIMEKTIELGRSFVTREYQRKPASLMLLWKGILYILLKHTEYRNLMGPVTVSGELSNISKTLIVKYLQRHHMHPKLSELIRPVTGLDGIDARIDFSLVEDIDSIDLINKIVTDIERDEFSIPVLIRKYLQLNSMVLGFNVDHDFSDCMDALMLLDLKKVPHETIGLLSKELTDIDVAARFKEL